MGQCEIDEILSLFDSKMIESGKKYLPLRTANEILSESDKFKNVNLKDELKSGKIPNAYQTDSTPKQWRIPYSDINNYAIRRKEYLRNNPKIPLPTNSTYSNQENNQRNSFGIIIFIVLIGLVGYFISTSDKNKSESGDLKSEACIISQQFVTKQLLSPKSAEFGTCFKETTKYLGDNRYLIKNYVDASNEFGAILRKSYTITMRFNSGEWNDINNWTLESIDIE